MRWIKELLPKAPEINKPLAIETDDTAIVPPVTQEFIIEEGHAFQHYQGFSGFIKKWNAHVSTSDRLDLQGDIEVAQVKLEECRQQATLSKSSLDAWSEAQKKQRKEHDPLSGISRKERKEMRRNLRRKEKIVAREFEKRERERRTAQACVDTARLHLHECDEQFTRRLNDTEIGFYVFEWLRNDPDAWDDFLVHRALGRIRFYGIYRIEEEVSAINTQVIRAMFSNDREKHYEDIHRESERITGRQMEKICEMM